MLEKKTENKAWKIISIVLNCIFYLFIALLLIFSISNLKMKDELSIPGLFGRGYLTVQTSSMDGEEKDSFTKNDLIYVKVVTDKNREKKTKNLEIGDIITFAYYSDEIGRTILNTHRIVDKRFDSENNLIFVTQGDKIAMDITRKYEKVPSVEKADDYISCYETVSYKDVKAIYTGKWSGFGKTMKFLQSPNGFLVCIVLPTALFFIFEAIMLVMNFNKIRNQKKELATASEHEEEMANMKAELEVEREKMRAEILAEMESKKDQEENKKEE